MPGHSKSFHTVTRSHEVKRLGGWAIYAKQFFDRVHFYLHSKENLQADPKSDQTKKMAQIITTAEEILLEVDSQFPFQLFPDSLRIDRQKVILTRRMFFGVAQIVNIQIKDLQAIEANIGPLFGSISITTKQFSNTVNKIHTLNRGDVLRAQHLLQGFIIANQKKLDYTKIEKNQLITMLKELGRGSDSNHKLNVL